MRFARVVSFVALVVLALGACFRDRAASGGGIHNAGGANGPAAVAASDVLAFLPADSEIVLGVDAQQVFGSPLWKRFEPQVAARIGAHLGEIKQRCGYDPIASLRGISLGLRVEGDRPSGVGVVHGIDRDKTVACFETMTPTGGKKVVNDGGFYVLPSDSGDSVVLTFADATTAVMSVGANASKATLQAALASGAPLRKSRAFSELWGNVDSKQTLWFVLNGQAKVFDALAGLGARPKAIVGSVGLANGLAMTSRARFESADQATQLSTMLQGQVGPFKAMVEELDLGADNTDLTVKLVMTVQQLEAIVGMMGGMLGGLGGP